MPMRASADDHHWDAHHDYHHWDRDHDDHHRDAHYHEWRWEREHDHYRAYPYNQGYAYGARQILPANGEGMIDRRNPNLYWACDGDGHNCHWARR